MNAESEMSEAIASPNGLGKIIMVTNRFPRTLPYSIGQLDR